MTSRLCVSITTFNRREMLLENIEAMNSLASTEIEVVVCDDGSTDGTTQSLLEQGITVISGDNKGVAWNKNRGVFYFNCKSDADVLLLLDDDVRITKKDWDIEWSGASKKFGHINNALYLEKVHLGSCTVEDPGLSSAVAGQVLGFSRPCLASVGYFDLRFGQYGHEHTDLSLRCVRAGFGGVQFKKAAEGYLFFVISGGIKILCEGTPGYDDILARNSRLLWELEKDVIFRPGWRNDDELQTLQLEMKSAGLTLAHFDNPFKSTFSPQHYLEENPDVRAAGIDPVAHYMKYGSREGRRI